MQNGTVLASARGVVLLGIWIVMGGGLAGQQISTSWQDKVDPRVLETAAVDSETEFIVYLKHQADLTGASHLSVKASRGRHVYELLSRTATATQAPILAELQRLGATYRPYWIANMVWVEGNRYLIQAMAERGDVARIFANPWVRLAEPSSNPAESSAPQAVEWNIARIGAPDFWNAGYRGQGTVVAGQDTGYDWEHPALSQSYRGWSAGERPTHDYNWHDAIHGDHDPNLGNPCGFDSPEPCDDHGHGTHTMGTMVGDDGGSNQIGVAPGARWIGCRNMESGVGSPTTYAECFQFFVAPTDLKGENADPARAPDVVNNSWACPPEEGCVDPTVLETVVENVRAAGIVVVVSAGNTGSSCETVDTPAAIYEASLTVGATNSAEEIAGFSSRGAATVDGGTRLKPDVSAPGVSIRSSLPGGSYGAFNGTSMAAPHVAGQVALLISSKPSLAGDVDRLEECIEGTARPRTTTESCSGVPGSQVPNNTFGWGRIELTWPPPAICTPSDELHADGFETGGTERWSDTVQ